MDAGGIVEVLAPLARALVHGTTPADDRAGRLWGVLATVLRRSPRALAAWRALARDPDDDEARGILRTQLALLIARDADLRHALTAAWAGATPPGGRSRPVTVTESLDDARERGAGDADPSLTPRGFDAPAVPARADQRIARKLQVWTEPIDPERPWLTGLVVGVGYGTPNGGVASFFDEAAAFAPTDDVVTLDVVATSADFAVASGPQTLQVGRAGPSRTVVHVALVVDGVDAGPREGTATVHVFKEGNFVAGLEVGLRVDGQGARIVGTEELGRPMVRLGALRPRQLSIVIRRSGDGYTVLAFGAVRADFTLRHTPEQLERMLLDARTALGKLVADRTFLSRITIPENVAQAGLDVLARAGFALFRGLFYDRGDPAAMEFGDRLRALAEKATLTVQVVSDDAFLPWGTLYLADATAAAGAVEPRRFLGFGHVVEQVLVGAQGESPAPELPTAPQVTVGMGVNRDIDTQFAMTAVADQLAMWNRVEQRTAATASAVRVRTRTTADEVRAALDDPDSAEDIWYFYCHAAAGSLADGGGPDAAYLELTGGTRVGLAELKNVLRLPPLPRRPLILVNACSSAAMSPLFYGGFLPYFLGRGARGVVGTECDVPALFAAEWANRFFRAFLGGRRSLGTVLLDVRTQFLDADRNPLGLLYALYCDADTVATPGAPWGEEIP